MLSQFFSQLLAEFIGTFLYVLTIPLAFLGVGDLAPLPTGFMLAAMSFCFSYISGAHFNPAISFAVFINRKISLKRFICYMIAQLGASVLASLYCSAIVGLHIPVPSVTAEFLSVWRSLLTEAIYTFAIVSVVMHVCYSRQRSNDFYGFAIGMTMTSAGFSVGGFTSGAFNPAVATGMQLVACIGGNCHPLVFFWVYWIAPLIGAFAAAIVFQIVNPSDRAAAAAAKVHHHVY